MINADLYIKVDLYEGDVEWKKDFEKENIGYRFYIFLEDIKASSFGFYHPVGYCGKENLEIAKKFANYDIKVLEKYIEEILGEEYKIENEKRLNLVKQNEDSLFINVEKDKTLRILRIPAVIQYAGILKEENGKKIIDFNYIEASYYGMDKGIITADQAIETEQAQKLIKANREENEKIRLSAEEKIKNTIITTDTNEYVEKPINIEIPKNNTITLPNINNTIPQEPTIEQGQANYQHIIVLSVIGFAIVVCIIVIIVDMRKKY